MFIYRDRQYNVMKVQKNIKIEEDLWKGVKHMSINKGVTCSSYMEDLIREALKKDAEELSILKDASA
jgi:hypothetical protein